MKTRDEIKQQHQKLKEGLKLYPDVPYYAKQGYLEIVKGQIQALGWVLGYKYKTRYFCVDCQKAHIHLKCPHCGNEEEKPNELAA